jgi:hypothetical protein
MPKTLLSLENQDFIKENYKTKSAVEMAKIIGVSGQVVRLFMKKNNLPQNKQLWIEYRTKNQLKDYSKDLEFIKDNFPKYDGKTLAKMMKISSVKIYELAREAGFSDLIEQRKKQTRIQPGSVPPNKGKKWDDWMSKEKQENVLKASFKKGNKPYNTKPFGNVRLSKEGYLLMKTKEIHKNRNFVPIHHLIYESFHGPINDKELIRFKNGNKYDLNPDNLEKVSMAQNGIINKFNDKSIAKKYKLELNPETKKLTETIRNSKLINHELNRKSTV